MKLVFLLRALQMLHLFAWITMESALHAGCAARAVLIIACGALLGGGGNRGMPPAWVCSAKRALKSNPMGRLSVENRAGVPGRQEGRLRLERSTT